MSESAPPETPAERLENMVKSCEPSMYRESVRVWAATLDEHDGDVQREDVLMGIRITAAASAC
ncbi:MAG: hypothetical protein ACRD12_06715, partial [Acidimicrobiales bacterium]